MKKFFMGLMGAQGEIQRKLSDYLQQMQDMATDMQKGIEAFLKRDMNGFNDLFRRINEAERRLDRLRRDIAGSITYFALPIINRVG